MFKQYTSIYGDESILLIVFNRKIGGISDIMLQSFSGYLLMTAPPPAPPWKTGHKLDRFDSFTLNYWSQRRNANFLQTCSVGRSVANLCSKKKIASERETRNQYSKVFVRVETKRFLGQYLQCWLSTKLQLVDSPAYREHVWFSFYFVSIDFLICHILSKGDLPTINPLNWDIKYHVFTQCQRI